MLSRHPSRWRALVLTAMTIGIIIACEVPCYAGCCQEIVGCRNVNFETDCVGTFSPLLTCFEDCDGKFKCMLEQPMCIPTLSEWGLILFAFLLLGTLAFYIRRTRRLATPAALGIFLLVFTVAFYFSSSL